MVLNFEQIKKLLPQRFPFLMVDRITEYEPNRKIVGIKNITGNEVFFQGHFPDEAIMPGALILEAMAQAAILFFQLSRSQSQSQFQSQLTQNQFSFLFGGVKAKFIKPVVPGDVLTIEMSPVKIISTGGIMEGKALVDGTIVTQAELSFRARERMT